MEKFDQKLSTSVVRHHSEQCSPMGWNELTSYLDQELQDSIEQPGLLRAHSGLLEA